MRTTFQITFDSHVLRGRSEREYQVTITADVHPGTCAADSVVECVHASIDGDVHDVTEAEFEALDEQAWDAAQDYLADWFEERREWGVAA